MQGLSKKYALLFKLKVGLFTTFLFFFAALMFSILFPRSWIIMDNIRLFFQKHIVKTFAEFRYSSHFNEIADTAKLLSHKRLSPGDIIFTSEESTLGSVFIEGKWKHVLIYLGTRSQLKSLFSDQHPFFLALPSGSNFNQEALLLDASFQGVKIKALSSLKNTESLVVIRLELTKKQIKKGLKSLITHLGKEYDFDFNTQDNSALYCSELMLPLFDLWGFKPRSDHGILRDIVSPTALLRALYEHPQSKKLVYMLFFIEKKGNTLRYQSKKALLQTIKN